MKKHVLGLALSLVSMLACSCAYAGWLDSPDNLQLQNVGPEMRLNGIPMDIRYFVTDQPADQLLKQFQDAWERSSYRTSVKKNKLGDWTVLNQSFGDEHRSVQIAQASFMPRSMSR